MLGLERFGLRESLKKSVKCYIRNTSAAIAIAFAVTAPVVVGAAGMAMDYAQAYLVKQRLIQALDSAALAAAASSSDPATIEQKVKDFFDVNYPEEKLGVTFEPEVEVVGDEVRVTGRARHNTGFLSLIGIDEIDVDAYTVVKREVQGIEVVLVLDNTGSMAGSKLASLKTASLNFMDILFANTPNPNFIKIGIVPYATSVNVGPYGIGENPDGSYYDTAFILNPLGVAYNPNGNGNSWQGCAIEEDPLDMVDHEGPWDMYRYCRRIGDDYPVCDYNTNNGVRTPRSNPNYICPKSHIIPMTNDYDLLTSSINDMEANGNTLGNLGMTWGWRVLSPDYPFTEGVGFDNNEWRKAIIMMTDGTNVMHRYTGHGWNGTHDIRTKADLDARFEETCELMKDEGTIIYTVTFSNGALSSVESYANCATSEGHHYHAPSNDELIDVFERISRELSNLHISG